MYQVFWVTSVVFWGLPLCHSQLMGQFDVIFQIIEVCPDVKVKNPIIMNTKFSKVGRKKVAISFDVNAWVPISDNITQKLDVAVKTQNGYKHNFFNMEGPLTKTLKNYVPEYYNKAKFPVPVGNYSVKNLIIDIKSTLIKTFFYGTYKVYDKFYLKNELIGCIDIIASTTPKRKS